MGLKVGFNARLLAFPSLRGWNRYTVNLLAELAGLGVEPYLYLEGPVHPEHLGRLPAGIPAPRVAPPMRSVVWEQRWLPCACDADGVDVLHCPLNYGLPWSSRCARVLTLHDAIGQVYDAGRPLRDRLAPRGALMSWRNWVARRRAHQVITVSEHAKGDLVRLAGIPADRIRVTYEAADRHFHEPVPEESGRRARAAHGLGRPYLFYIGGWELRKNLPFLIRAFAAAAPDLGAVELVLAGGQAEQRPGLLKLAGDLGVADRVRLLGWVDDEDLPALYAGATAFAYPSEYEGFGLQLCEAMAAGCPTLAARATCLPEVLGGGGETFALDDVGELAGLLRRVVNDPAARADLAARARARAADFSWRRTAEQTVAVYERALAAAR